MIDAKTARLITKTEEQMIQEQVDFWLEKIELGIRKSASDARNNYETDYASEKIMNRLQTEIEKLGFKVHQKVVANFVSLKIEW